MKTLFLMSPGVAPVLDHTPTPWKPGANTSEPGRFVKSEDGEILIYFHGPLEVAKVNAAFVVNACNAWEDAAKLRARLAEIERGIGA